MDYTSIHIYGHLLSDDILHSVEQDSNFVGNAQQDYGIDAAVDQSIDYVWSSLRNDWNFYKERSLANDPYGTRRARDLISRLLSSLGYVLKLSQAKTVIDEQSYDITYFADNLDSLPVIVVGDLTGNADIDTLDRCSLDYRAKGAQRRRSPHATMLEYLNSTESVYGIVANGQTLRLIRNSGQLVKLTYIEFDLRRMLDEDKYSEFRLMFRLLHASRYRTSGDEPCIMERWFNMSIESGNRIRAGLSEAVQRAMERIGKAALSGEKNEALRQAFIAGDLDASKLNKELIHFIYRLLFLFIIEDRGLVYQIPAPENQDYNRLCQHQEVYNRFYAVSRLRGLSEVAYLHNSTYDDLWQGLMDTFRLFEDETFGSSLSIKPLGGVLFGSDTLYWLKQCSINNADLLAAFSALNLFTDERKQLVKINYSALDVEEFGSVYEGVLELRPFVKQSAIPSNWEFGYICGLDRKSTSSYYTRPDLVQNLIRTTLEPVIKDRISKLKTPEEKVQSLLSMKVCDPSSGSGHIVLAMARTIAWYVSTIRTGEDNPASLDYREALREVIAKCVYAVDYNPDAVELCKVVLWIEGYCAGKPLSFLDHHIRCGNSVVGVSDLDLILKGVPESLFVEKGKKASREDKDVYKKIRKINNDALKDISFFRDGATSGFEITIFSNEFRINNITEEQIGLAQEVKRISAMPENTLAEEIAKKKSWEMLMSSPRVECLRRACDIYTYSFYYQFTEDDVTYQTNEKGETYLSPIPFSSTVYQALEEIKMIDGKPKANFTPLPDAFKQEVSNISSNQRFFHWCVEFPEVFVNGGGFDVMCGNPPWDKIKVDDKGWFNSQGYFNIGSEKDDKKRKKLKDNLFKDNPDIERLYLQAHKDFEAMSYFVRCSNRFKLTAKGDIDLYPMFAEICLQHSKEAWGLVLPTAIAIADSNKDFFSKLIDENRLISIYDFENREALFDIHRMFKFCLLTAGKAQSDSRKILASFYLTQVDQIFDTKRKYELKPEDIRLFNPNSKTAAVSRTQKDIDLLRKIYQNSKILINDINGDNPWKITLGSHFHMTSDKPKFKTYSQLIELGAELQGNKFILNGLTYVPLYEGKMFWLYDHHFGTWPTEGKRPNSIDSPNLEEYANVEHSILPWYWISENDVAAKLIKINSKNEILWEWKHKWLLAYRCISNATNERTFIPIITPDFGFGNSATLIYSDSSTLNSSLLLGILSSIVFDFAIRQKVGGTNLNSFFVKQFPVLTPEQISVDKQWEIAKRVAQLCYFNHDLDGWAEEMWDEMNEAQRAELPQLGNKQPFIYNPDHRAVLQAEIDAIIAHLYGLTTDELCYILDPEDVCGPGCINETFRVLKDNETRQYGEYRTKRLVLEAWHRFNYEKIN